jgi:hypothetical protein
VVYDGGGGGLVERERERETSDMETNKAMLMEVPLVPCNVHVVIVDD